MQASQSLASASTSVESALADFSREGLEGLLDDHLGVECLDEYSDDDLRAKVLKAHRAGTIPREAILEA